jgi:hypothetical protein
VNGTLQGGWVPRIVVPDTSHQFDASNVCEVGSVETVCMHIVWSIPLNSAVFGRSHGYTLLFMSLDNRLDDSPSILHLDMSCFEFEPLSNLHLLHCSSCSLTGHS